SSSCSRETMPGRSAVASRFAVLFICRHLRGDCPSERSRLRPGVLEAHNPPATQKSGALHMGMEESGRFYSRMFAMVTVALLAFMLFKVLRPFAGSIAWALLIAFLLHPAHDRLRRLFRGRESLSAGLLTVATLLICIGPLTGLTVAFARQAAALLERLQQHMGGVDITSVE